MEENRNAIIIGSDHGGFELKEFLKTQLERLGLPYKDIGTSNAESTDYPIWAGRVAKAVADGLYARGIAVCGTGIGASIAANRFRGVRAALCTTDEMARLSREHNNANVLVLGGRTTARELAAKILETWLTTKPEGGRHERRTKQLDDIENAIK